NVSLPTWQEVTLLLSSIMIQQGKELQVWSLLNSLTKNGHPQLIWLSAKIINEKKISLNGDIAPFFCNILKKAFSEVLIHKTDLSIANKIEIAEALNFIGDNRPGVGIDNDGLPDIRWDRINSGLVTIGSTEENIRLLKENLHSDWQFERETPAFKTDVCT